MNYRSRLGHCAGLMLRLFCLMPAAAAVTGCAGKPFLLDGDANSAQVGYSGNDPTVAAAVAKDACARYERVPRFLNAAENVAYFTCEQP
jgi:hypothetical protein